MRVLSLEEQNVVFYEAELRNEEPRFTYAQYEDGTSLTDSELKALTAKYIKIARDIAEVNN